MSGPARKGQALAKRSSSASGLATAVAMDFDDAGFSVRLSIGRMLRYRFDEFEFLRGATPAQRVRGIVDSKGTALWWEDLLEGISVAGLIGVSETELEAFAGVYR